MGYKTYNVAVIDDEQDIQVVFDIVKNELHHDGFEVNFTYINYLESENFHISDPYDIVIFDCNFNASNFLKLQEDGKSVGYVLIKKFRERNKRTKVILYSGTFDIANDYLPFSKKQLISMINDFNVFKIIERDPNLLMNSIKEAIQELDIIMVCMEDIYSEYSDNDVIYELNGKEIEVKELIEQLKNGGNEAEKFRKNVLESLLYFMLKFKD